MKGPSTIDKRLQEQKCPYCERVFKQVCCITKKWSTCASVVLGDSPAAAASWKTSDVHMSFTATA